MKQKLCVNVLSVILATFLFEKDSRDTFAEHGLLFACTN